MDFKKYQEVISKSEAFAQLKLEPIGEENIDDKGAEQSYANDSVTLTAKYDGDKFGLYNENGDRVFYALLSQDAEDKDIKFVASDLSETLIEKYSPKKVQGGKKNNVRAPQTVSKAAVKAGSSYDANTLASRLCIVFPELRDQYKANIAAHNGEFFAQEFFVEYGTPVVISAIKNNKPATMKKMFNVLNEMYEDGTNDLQSLIAVTIMGELNNDQILLARCVDYMSETMAPPVIEVNKFLVSRKGKKAKAKMLNPPAYKPKKKKSGGFLQNMMGGGQGNLQNN